MNESIRRELAQSSRLFWERAPWKTLIDEDFFGLRDLESGIVACASVIGKAGYQRGLALSLGEEGFEVVRQLRDSEMDRDQFSSQADMMALYYSAESEIPKGKRDEMGVLTRIPAHPEALLAHALRKRPHEAASLPDDREARFLARALRAIPELLASKRLSPRRLRRRTRLPLFVLPASVGEEILEEDAPTPAPNPRGLGSTPPVEFPEAMRVMLQDQRREGTLLVSLLSGPISIQSKEARILIVFDPDRAGLLLAHALVGTDAVAQAARYFYSILAGDIPSASGARVPVPRKLVTDSLEFYAGVKDALAELGIEILYAETVPPLDQLRQSLLDHLSGESPRG